MIFQVRSFVPLGRPQLHCVEGTQSRTLMSLTYKDE
jgi:hypothetical protein